MSSTVQFQRFAVLGDRGAVRITDIGTVKCRGKGTVTLKNRLGTFCVQRAMVAGGDSKCHSK